jgi:glycosyltransferase involved in cell wall biosynthesis
MKISVIIPCFNEEQVIASTLERVKKVLIEIGQEYEILFINDGSRDNTYSILEGFAKSDHAIKLISFSRNFGHQPAVTAGIHSCSGDVAIIIDADLQDPPELFPEMIKIYREKNCNVVYAVRTQRKGESFFKKLTAKMYYRLINYLSDVKLPKDTGDFRLIDRKVIEEFKKLQEHNKYIRGLISWVGFKQEPVYYTRDPRLLGETKYPLRKMLKFALTGMLYFTKKPLKLAVTLGLFCFFIGIAMIIYVLIRKLFQENAVVPGWASTMLMIIFFGGIQLLSVGILGEYIGSIFDEIKKRPEYIIDKKVNFN